MLDIKFVRENPDILKADLAKRGWTGVAVDDVLAKDQEFRRLNQEVEQLRGERNKISREINEVKKKGKDANALLKRASEIPQKIKNAEETTLVLKKEIHDGLMRLPNLLDSSVPVGKDDSENVVVREVGGREVPDFGIKSHVDLITERDLADIERAAKTSGARFYFLKNELVLLDLALQRFALDFLAKKGFNLISPPSLMRREPYEGVTDLRDFEDVMYKIEGEDLYLIATSEHPMAAMHSGEVIDEDLLPLKYAGVSQCFRKEAGAHGKDTKGIFRVHQFSKVEQFVFAKPQDSWVIHEQLLANAEEIFQALEIPYRVVNICTGDIGTVAAKKYDIEAWMPAQGKYREVVSCSNCTAYQSVRLNIKCGKQGGERNWLHTLNSTAIANPRAIVAIIENHQQEDGKIRIPKALQAYMGGRKLI